MEGKFIGLMVYQMMGFVSPMKVKHFLYLNALGKHLLLRYIALHVDQVDEVRLHLPPGEAFETWAPDAKCKTENSVSPSHTGNQTQLSHESKGGMSRVIMVEKLSGIHVGFKDHLSFTAKIVDAMCSWNNGVFAFESKDGLLEVKRVESKESSITLTIEGLTSLVYNGIDPR